MSLIMPTNRGWTVAWDTTREVKRRDGTVTTIKVEERAYSKSRKEIEAKAKALKEAGYEVGRVTECFF